MSHREGAATKMPKKMKSVGVICGVGLCHEHKTSESTANVFFAKENGPRKLEVSYIIFDYYNLYQARSRPGPEFYRATRQKPGPCLFRPPHIYRLR